MLAEGAKTADSAITTAWKPRPGSRSVASSSLAFGAALPWQRAGVADVEELTLNGGDGDGDGVMTVGEALDTIEARLRRRLQTSGNHPVWVRLSERLERLRRLQLDQAQASVEFLSELFDLARQVTAAEKADDEGRLDDLSLLPDPNVGALTQILREYAPPNTPVIIEEVVSEIDAIVKQVRFTGWTTSQPGDRTVRKELKLTLKKFGLPTGGELFDRAYAYIRENY